MARTDQERFLQSNVALIASIAVIAVVTLTPMQGKNHLHLRPLDDVVAAFSPSLRRGRLVGLIGNVMLFAPLGAVLGVRGLKGLQVVIIGASLSTAIETTQLFIPGRTTSADDVLLNTLGAALGFVVAARRSSPPP
jgi:glycopeptide antibiotics resistance protein